MDVDGTERMHITSDGNVGIGVSPASLLHIESDSADPTLRITNKTTAAINTGADIEFWNNPFTGSTTNAYESGAIRVRKNNGSDNNHDHYMAFEVRKNSPEGINEVMRLKHGGQVGIGTSTNVGNLSVNSGISSSSSSNVITIHQATDGNDKPVVGFGTAIGNGGESTNAGDLIISTASGGSLGERVRIKSDGALTLLEKASAISNSLRFQAIETVGDDETQNYTMDGTCCIVILANHSSDDAALFFMSYASSTITKIADPSNEYDTSATDGKSCIYKSSNSATFTIENKRGGARNMGVAQIAVTSTV
jgi:DNA-binding XRE family transcriptional regulator